MNTSDDVVVAIFLFGPVACFVLFMCVMLGTSMGRNEVYQEAQKRGLVKLVVDQETQEVDWAWTVDKKDFEDEEGK